MNRLPKPFLPLIALSALFFLIQCAPAPANSIVEVEITRVVEVTRPVAVEVPFVTTQEVVVTREVPVEVTRIVIEEAEVLGEPGTPDRPIQVVFLPSDTPALIEVRGGVLIDYLTQATGYAYESVIPSSNEEALALICDNPDGVIAILDQGIYVQAADECGAQVTHAATRFDVPYTLGMLVARRDRVINVLEDMRFKTIGVATFEELTTYRYFSDLLSELEITPVEYISTETDSAALISLLEDQVDAVAVAYNPPILPNEERIWEYGVDRPDAWRQFGVDPDRNPVGYVDVLGGPDFGGYRLRDARAVIFDDYPEAFTNTRIIALSEPVPNEAIAFGRTFPFTAAQAIVPALEEFAASEECGLSVCASDFYQWDGIAPVEDSFYDVYRAVNAADAAADEENN